MWRWGVSGCALAAALAAGTTAWAQTGAPPAPQPANPTADANGVDLITGILHT